MPIFNKHISRRKFIRDTFVIASASIVIPKVLVGQNKNEVIRKSGFLKEGLYPDDAFSSPAEDKWSVFETLDGCQIKDDVKTRSSLFIENEIKLINMNGLRNTQWRIRSKETESTGLVFISDEERIRRKPERISFIAANLSSDPVILKIQFNEMAWKPGNDYKTLSWELGKGQFLNPGEERELTFLISDIYCPERTGIKEPGFPVNAILIVEGLKPEIPYQLNFSRFNVFYPYAAELEVKKLVVSPVITAGKGTEFKFDLSGNIEGKILDLELRNGNRVVWRIRLGEEETSVRRKVPWWISNGEYILGLVADGYRVKGPEEKIRIINSLIPQLAKTKRKNYKGRPALFVDGKPFAWQGYSSYDYQPGNVTEFGAHGTNLFIVPTCAGSHVHHIAASTWVGPDNWDFGELTERVNFSLQGNPDAKLCLRVSLTLPPFWIQEHPDDRVLIRTDEGDLAWEETASRCIPLASESWKVDQEKALRKLIKYCKSQPWAGRLIGFMLTTEVTEEWFAWGCNDGMYSDYSKLNQAAFAGWLNRTEENLIPSPDVRKSEGNEIYPGTHDGTLAAEYNQFYSDLTANTICHFAKIVKDETEGRSMVGVFYGYVIQLAGEPRQSLAGQFGLRRLIDDNDVDFLAGIPILDFRQLSGGYSAFTTTVNSLQAAGKLFLDENDLFSWLHPGIWYNLGLYDKNNPRKGAYSMHQRVTAQCAVYGVFEGKFSLMTSWHHDDGLQNEFKKLSGIYTKTTDLDRTPVEEIAFIVDDNSFAHTPPGSKKLMVNKELFLKLALTGAPVGVWLMSDLDKLPDRTKLVVVAGCHSPAPEDVIKLNKLIEKGQKTVLISGKDNLDETGVLRKLVEKAGVHCYAPEGFSVHASSELVAITSSTQGKVVLNWYHRVSVHDLFDDWTGHGKSFSCPFETGQTRLFRLNRET
jgi:hypothetical protein